jgi:EAL domain-containing protein (putative c-di-GMP-specific phosphodiesterase class I)
MHLAQPLARAHVVDSARADHADALFDAALERLLLVYQPIVDAPRQRVFGYEALVRSGEPAMASPGALFDAAERLGRTQELGRRIRALAADGAERCPEGCTLFINLHPSDLLDPQLYDASRKLAGHASRIVLELTERAPVDRIADVQARVGLLRGLGYRIAVDDLGAGYAGLSSLVLLTPDVVKLDMSLVRGIDESSRKQSIVRSMLDLCERELEVEVVSEGVETEREHRALTALGGRLLQGYHFGRPSPTFVDPFA